MGHNRNLADYAHHFDGTHIDLGSGNIETQGVLTYEDVTNVDAIGIITARAGVKVPDNQKVLLGTGDDLQIFHNGNHSVIADVGTGNLQLRAEDFRVTDSTNAEVMIRANTNAEVELYYNNSKKLETTTTGATVTGTLVSDSVTSELDLTAISSSISDTAVDIFVYDTRKDSDGGAWRKRTTHTSWYNETLGTSTRGTRREFPAVAVLVLQGTVFTIYDGDDPDLPMWMVFNKAGNSYFSITTNSCVTALNGKIVSGGNASNDRLRVIDFLLDNELEYSNASTGQRTHLNPISGRNSTTGFTAYDSSLPGIVNRYVNDVAMTVLPNAPIDENTGLPVPTIALATNGGVSVIKDDGNIVSSAGDSAGLVEYLDNNYIIITRNNNTGYFAVHNNHFTSGSWNANANSYYSATIPVFNQSGYINGLAASENGYFGNNIGVHIYDALSSSATNTNGLFSNITTSYNTGWMHGDIKGAFLSDTDTTNSIEYVQNGYFNNDVSSWTIGTTGTTATLNANRLLITAPSSGASWGYVYQGITTEVGKTYKISLHYDRGNVDGRINVRNDSSNTVSGSLFYEDLGTSSDGKTYYNTFTATATTTYILLYAKSTSGGTSAYDEVSVTLEKDHSINNNGLQVYGTVTKQPVATGAELVSYSGWSSSNYLRQPYNSDLDFGTGNWSYMFWYNPNDAESGDVIFSRWSYNVDSNQGPRVTAYFNSGNLRVDTADASAGSGYQGHFGSDGTQDSNEWHCAVILRRGPNLEIWIDGVNYKNATLNSTSDGNYTDTNAILEIGHSPNSGAPEAGLELALFRVSATAPSPEQVKKMYEDEKVLFQENAKATLYGSSDAVTALAYDEDTELLHVGTSAGRSDFQGLRRINNTTTAVTTAISASDELIAEQ